MVLFKDKVYPLIRLGLNQSSSLYRLKKAFPASVHLS